jgi:hypothetical protein
MENTDDTLNTTVEDTSVAVATTVQVQEKPQHHLVDMFFGKFRVDTDILALLRGITSHVLDVKVTRVSDGLPMTIRFVQGSRSSDFRDGTKPRIFDLLLVLDKHYKTMELFQKGISGALMRDHGLIPFLVNATVQTALINQAWTDTSLVQNKIFALNYNARVYADYMSIANALFHILENGWRATPYTVVMMCRVGTERSLLVLALFMLILHGVRVMNELRPEATLVERVTYMRHVMEEVDMSEFFGAHATEVFASHLKLLSHKLANLPVYAEPVVGATAPKQGIKRHLCFFCREVVEPVYSCPFTRMVACDKTCLVMGHAALLESTGLKRLFN